MNDKLSPPLLRLAIADFVCLLQARDKNTKTAHEALAFIPPPPRSPAIDNYYHRKATLKDSQATASCPVKAQRRDTKLIVVPNTEPVLAVAHPPPEVPPPPVAHQPPPPPPPSKGDMPPWELAPNPVSESASNRGRVYRPAARFKNIWTTIKKKKSV